MCACIYVHVLKKKEKKTSISCAGKKRTGAAG